MAESFSDKLLRTLARWLLVAIARLISGAGVRWIQSQPDVNQRIYFANHTSHLDAIVIWSLLPPNVRQLTRPVAARDYWEKGKFRQYLARNVFGALLIDRTNIKVSRSPVDMMLQEIGDRYSLIVFPEGPSAVAACQLAPRASSAFTWNIRASRVAYRSISFRLA